MGAKLQELREKGLKLINKLPYQEIKDSPTIKYYTDWTTFDKFSLPNIKPIDSRMSYKLLPRRVNILLAGDKTIINPHKDINFHVHEMKNIPSDIIINSRIQAIHYASLINAREIRIEDGNNSKEPLRITIESVLGTEVHEGYHLKIIIGNSVNATIELFELGLSDKSAMNSVIEIFIGENSNLELIHINKPSSKTPSFSHVKALISKNSSLSVKALYLGGLMHRQQFSALLLGEKAVLKNSTIVLGEKSYKIDYVFDGLANSSNNVMDFYGIGMAQDNSYVSIRAFGRISRNSKGASVDVRSITYNVGEESKAVASPILEINSNNVTLARHSISISNISKDKLFYLMSRGFSPEEIRKLFRKEIIASILIGVNEEARRDLMGILNYILK